MSTTRQAYRPAYRPEGAPIEVESECTCGQTFPNLGELFGHDCPDDPRFNGASRIVPNVATTRADSLDVPEWQGGAAGHAPDRATDAQLVLIAKLAGEVEHDVDVAGLTKRSASRLIDQLLEAVNERKLDTYAAARLDGANDHEAMAQASKAPCRPNRYPGDCSRCGANVPAGEGLLCKQDGRWAVTHADGACIAAERPTAANPATLADVPAGHYAIPSTGDNDLVFYRVDRPTEGAYAGRTFVKMIVGGHPDRNVRRDAVAGILERIAADPDAGPRYGREVGRCRRCNRHLTDEASRSAGIGPECAKV